MTHHQSYINLQEEKEKLMIQLGPYENIILRFEEILYGKEPLLLIMGVIIFDTILIFGHFSQMGIISLFVLYCMVIYILYFLQHRFNIMKLVPKVDIIKNENGKNTQVHSLDEICQFLASLKQKLGMITDYLLGNQFENIYKIIYVLAVWFTLAFVFNIIGNFWLFFIIINLSLLTPGFNITVLIFGWISQLIHAVFSVFVNPQQGNGPPIPPVEDAAPHPQPQEQSIPPEQAQPQTQEQAQPQTQEQAQPQPQDQDQPQPQEQQPDQQQPQEQDQIPPQE